MKSKSKEVTTGKRNSRTLKHTTCAHDDGHLGRNVLCVTVKKKKGKHPLKLHIHGKNEAKFRATQCNRMLQYSSIANAMPCYCEIFSLFSVFFFF
jgi:hypothetical protein